MSIAFKALGRTSAFILAAAAAFAAGAQPIQLVDGTINMFRDTRGANDVGIGQGNLVQYGADVVGGALGVSLGARYGAFTQLQFGCQPLAVNADFCSRSLGFNAGRLDPWTLRFERGANNLEVQGPSLLGTENPVPFPVSVSISGTGLTPTISWQVPAAFAPDGFRVNVFDKSRILAGGNADVIHSQAINPSATSFTLPSTLSSGLVLQEGGNYTISLQLIETRNHIAFTGNNAEILRRSASFFAFTPLSGDVPNIVSLPTVANGVYNFNVAEVGPTSITFIDPFVAVGYDYAVGAGDPNFASVKLPNVGDGEFTLEFSDASGDKSVALSEGVQYFFGQGGVSAFKVRGIETAAGLDPDNVTAFITGLTFTEQGSFTGTMTPVTVFVPIPEPSTYAMFALGLAGLAAARRRMRTD